MNLDDPHDSLVVSHLIDAMKIAVAGTRLALKMAELLDSAGALWARLETCGDAALAEEIRSQFAQLMHSRPLAAELADLRDELARVEFHRDQTESALRRQPPLADDETGA